jgi:hypothetical protein
MEATRFFKAAVLQDPYGATSQKAAFFIVAVKTSNPIFFFL